jgi:hypothetical protein
MPVAVYRRGDQRVRMRTTGTSVLPSGAGEAQRRLLELIEAEQGNKAVPVAPAAAQERTVGADARTASL